MATVARETFLWRSWCLALLLTVCFVLSIPVAAQLPTATISGAGKDSSGAVIPGATITVTNVETGLSRGGATGADGSYKFPALPVGTSRQIQFGLKVEF